MRTAFVLFTGLFLFSFTACSQLLTDEPTKLAISKGLDKLYNFEFTDAEELFKPVKSHYANHPVSDLLAAIQLQWRHLPIEESAAFGSYLAHLQNCRKKAEILAKNPVYKAEATFFLLAAHGFTALSANYKKDYAKAVNEARQAYGYLKDGFKFTAQNPDFYYTTGTYNYYRIQYPITHPITKPLLVFFQDGNKTLGKQQLALAGSKSMFSRTEALSVLGHIGLKYERDFAMGLRHLSFLGKKYPNNPIFRMRYIEALLLNNQFELANQLNASLRQRSGSIFGIASNFFSGYEAEIHDKNDKAAMGFYQQALKLKPDSRYTDDYFGMANLGMGRIFYRSGDKARAKVFFKNCLQYAQYGWVREEAEDFLTKL